MVRLAAQIVSIDATSIALTSFDGTPVTFPRAIANDRGFAWRTVPAPEPAYEVGGLYQDTAGDVFERTAAELIGDQWRVVLSATMPLGQYVHHDRPGRPLRRLIPE